MGTELDCKDTMERVEAVLSPFIGRSLAGASVEVHVKKMKLGPTVSLEEFEEFLTQLANGVMVFVGANKTKALVQRIRREVMEGPP